MHDSGHEREHGDGLCHVRITLRIRFVLGCCCALLLVAVIATIWFLTAQTPEETTALTRSFAVAIDDVVHKEKASGWLEECSDGFEVHSIATGGIELESTRMDSREVGNGIEVRSMAHEVREGDFVVFSVHAPEAIAYRWECTDDLTDGWYEMSGVDLDSDTLRFELTPDRIWMQDCQFRCMVTYPDGSTDYSDEIGFGYRDLSSLGGVYRRAAHVVEFGFVGAFASLTVLLLRGESGVPRSLLMPTLVFCAINSLIDQTHKLFVPGREFDILDLPLDALGYVSAVLLVFAVWSVSRNSRRWRRGGGVIRSRMSPIDSCRSE